MNGHKSDVVDEIIADHEMSLERFHASLRRLIIRIVAVLILVFFGFCFGVFVVVPIPWSVFILIGLGCGVGLLFIALDRNP